MEQRGRFNSIEEDIRNIREKYQTAIIVFTMQDPSIAAVQKVIKISGDQELPIRNSIKDIVTSSYQ